MVTLCPCHHDVSVTSSSPYCLLHRCDCDRSSSSSRLYQQPSETVYSGPVLPRGVAFCTATASVNAWTIFSIIYRFCLGPWLLSGGTCIDSSPWIQRSPSFCPWWKEERARKQKQKNITIERYWLHSASPNRPPLP